MWPVLNISRSILLSRHHRYRFLPLLVVTGVTLVFPDLTWEIILNFLHTLWFVVHGAIGWFELSIEHLLEWSLGVSRHTAQILTAWLGLFLILYFLVWLARYFTLKLAIDKP